MQQRNTRGQARSASTPQCPLPHSPHSTASTAHAASMQHGSPVHLVLPSRLVAPALPPPAVAGRGPRPGRCRTSRGRRGAACDWGPALVRVNPYPIRIGRLRLGPSARAWRMRYLESRVPPATGTRTRTRTSGTKAAGDTAKRQKGASGHRGQALQRGLRSRSRPQGALTRGPEKPLLAREGRRAREAAVRK